MVYGNIYDAVNQGQSDPNTDDDGDGVKNMVKMMTMTEF